MPKASVGDFASRVKAKYPEYASIPDEQLARRIVEKYPEYSDSVDLSPEKGTIDLLKERLLGPVGNILAPVKPIYKAAEKAAGIPIPGGERLRGLAQKYADPAAEPIRQAMPASALIPRPSQLVATNALEAGLLYGPEVITGAIGAARPVSRIASQIQRAPQARAIGEAMAGAADVAQETSQAMSARAALEKQLTERLAQLTALERGQEQIRAAAGATAEQAPDLVRGRFFLGQQLAAKQNEALTRSLLETKQALAKLRSEPTPFVEAMLARRRAALPPEVPTPPSPIPPSPPPRVAPPPIAGGGGAPVRPGTPGLDALAKSGAGRYVIPQSETVARAEAQRAAGLITPESFVNAPPRSVPAPAGSAPADVVESARQFATQAAKTNIETASKVDAGAMSVQEAAAIGRKQFQQGIATTDAIGEAARATNIMNRGSTQERAWRNAMRSLRDELAVMPDEQVVEYMREMARIDSDPILARRLAQSGELSKKNKWVAMFQELRGASLLTSPLTFDRNFVGNVAGLGTNVIERFGTGGVAEGSANIKGMISGASKALDDAWRGWNLELGVADKMRGAPAIPGRIGRVIRTPFRILNATDAFFRSLLESGEVAAQLERYRARTGQSLISPTDDMLDAAIKVADEYTFQNELGGFGQRMQGLLEGNNWVSYALKEVIPFFKTPVNLAKFGFNRLPGTAPLQMLVGTPAREALVKNATGMLALTSAKLALHAVGGEITGAWPKDPREREDWQRTGKKAYSVFFNGKWHPFQSLEPLSSYLRALAEYNDWAKKNPMLDRPAYERAARSYVAAIFNSAEGFLDQPFTQSLQQLLEAMKNNEGGLGQRAQRFAKTTAASHVPSGLGALTRSIDKTVRSPQTTAEFVKARLPKVSESVRPRLDRFGQPMSRAEVATPDPLSARLLQLGLSGAIERSPRRIAIAGVERPLSPDQENLVSATAGPMIRNSVSQTINEPGFNLLPRAIQESRVRKLVADAREVAILQLGGLAGEVELAALGLPVPQDQGRKMAISILVKSPAYRLMDEGGRKEILNRIMLGGPR